MDQSFDTNINDTSMTQRRNKKRKPPNYYQNPEYQAILITNEQENSDNFSKLKGSNNSSSASLTQGVEVSEANANKPVIETNEANEPLKINQEPEETVKLDETQIEVVIQEPKIEEPPVQEIVIIDNIPKIECEPVNEIIPQVEPVNSEIIKTEEKLEQTIEKLSIKENQVTENTQSSQNSNTSQSAASKSWSSLFKSNAAQAAAASTLTSTIPTVNSTNKPQSNQRTNSKTPLGASISLPISTSTNHIHLNGNSHTNGLSDTNTNDSLKILGNLFKQCDLKHSAPALQPRGIRNKQNWCYINAVRKFYMKHLDLGDRNLLCLIVTVLNHLTRCSILFFAKY